MAWASRVKFFQKDIVTNISIDTPRVEKGGVRGMVRQENEAMVGENFRSWLEAWEKRGWLTRISKAVNPEFVVRGQ